MDTRAVTADRLKSSVIAVPPLALTENRLPDWEQNRRLITYLESGGISILLYGGNAVFYHLRPSIYAETLARLAEFVAPGTLVIPSVGPAYGLMMDQADVLRDLDFPTVMILTQRDVADARGIERGIRDFAERLGRPVVVYVKFDGWLEPRQIAQLDKDGLVSWIKYAIVRPDPTNDPYLTQLIDLVPPERIVSGMGEQPALAHLRDFGLAGFTSGCVCVAPRLAMRMLGLLQQRKFDEAERIRQQFKPLEDLRDSIHPIRVLHRAVALAEIADTGPMTPLLGELTEADGQRVAEAAKHLKELDQHPE